MFSTWEQGFKTLPAKVSPTMPLAPYTEKTGFHKVHWMLVSIGPERPVSGSNEDASVGLRPDAGSLRDRMLTGCVRSQLKYTDDH